MRVSEKGRFEVTSSRVEQAKENNLKNLETMSTQKRISRVSDDPISLGQAIKIKSKISKSNQYLKNISYAKGFIESTESVVKGLSENLVRAKELALGMSNSTYAPDSRVAVAREIGQLIDGVIQLGNTSYGNRYVFSGYRTLTPPLSQDGNYIGDDGAIFIQVDEGQFKQINVKARELFEAGDEDKERGKMDMIQSLSALYDSLISDDLATIRKVIHDLDYQMDKVSNFQAVLGSVSNALTETERRLELFGELDTANLSNLEDADYYKATSDFKNSESVLQGTLLASNKLLQPSLLNFLQ